MLKSQVSLDRETRGLIPGSVAVEAEDLPAGHRGGKTVGEMVKQGLMCYLHCDGQTDRNITMAVLEVIVLMQGDPGNSSFPS